MNTHLTAAKWIDGKWCVQYDSTAPGMWQAYDSPIDALIDMVMRKMGYVLKEEAVFAMGGNCNILFRYRRGAKVPTSWLFHAHEVTGIPAAELRAITDTKHPNF